MQRKRARRRGAESPFLTIDDGETLSCRREQCDQDIEDQGQAKAQQGQPDEADAGPQFVDSKSICETGAHTKDHAILTVTEKLAFHLFVFLQSSSWRIRRSIGQLRRH